MSGLIFRDPPPRHIEVEADTLRALMEHPGKWALVAEAVLPAARRRFDDARRKVGAQGEFTIRQSATGDAGLVDLYVRYDEDGAA